MNVVRCCSHCNYSLLPYWIAFRFSSVRWKPFTTLSCECVPVFAKISHLFAFIQQLFTLHHHLPGQKTQRRQNVLLFILYDRRHIAFWPDLGITFSSRGPRYFLRYFSLFRSAFAAILAFEQESAKRERWSSWNRTVSADNQQWLFARPKNTERVNFLRTRSFIC